MAEGNERHRATLPTPNPTRPFWATSPDPRLPPSEGSTGLLATDADLCIIGSGITGISGAYHLAKLLSTRRINRVTRGEFKVVILEARDFCSGATGRNGGHLTETRQFFSEFSRLEEQQGTDEVLRAKALEKHNVESIINFVKTRRLEGHVDLVQGGLLTLYLTDEEYRVNREMYESTKEAGVDLDGIRWLTTEETKERFGACYPAMLSPGNNLWPRKLVEELYLFTRDFGLSEQSQTKLTLTVHTHTPVTAVNRTPQEPSVGTLPRRYSVSTPRGPITCTYVFHATNAYVSHLLPHMGGPGGVIPTRGQVIATRAKVPSGTLTNVAGSANKDYEYWFPRPARSSFLKEDMEEKPLIILGGGREGTLPNGGEFYIADDSTLNPDVSKSLREFLPTTFPGRYQVGNEPEMEWTGIMGFTKSTDPFVGPVYDPSKPEGDASFDGQYVSAGYTGHGMPRAFACAEVVAQMIVSDMDGKQWEAPEWFPVSYLTKVP